MLKINCQDPRIYLIWGSLLIITSFLEVGRWGVTWLEASRPTSCGSGLGSALAFLGQLRGRNIWLWGNSVWAVTKHCWSSRWQGNIPGPQFSKQNSGGKYFHPHLLTFHSSPDWGDQRGGRCRWGGQMAYILTSHHLSFFNQDIRKLKK